jgi:transposase
MLQILESYLSKVLLQKKRHGAMQKLYIKNKEKRVGEKMDKCPRYLKQWVFRCSPKKKR